MATTATNKQPLLIDRVLHSLVKGNKLVSGSATALEVSGTNESAVLVDCLTNDGAIIEDLYAIARTTDGTAYTCLFYLSSSNDYLRPNDTTFIGSLESSTTGGAITSADALPKILAPVPQVDDGSGSSQFRALYVPKGKALWVTLQLTDAVDSNEVPIIGAQGGFY